MLLPFELLVLLINQKSKAFVVGDKILNYLRPIALVVLINLSLASPLVNESAYKVIFRPVTHNCDNPFENQPSYVLMSQSNIS